MKGEMGREGIVNSFTQNINHSLLIIIEEE